MSCAAGPNIIEDRLVLHVDAANINKFSQLPLVEYLIVGGGGGGGQFEGGGGGGGGLLYGHTSVGLQSYTVTVGAGGAGATTRTTGSSGENSSAFGITAFGGGGGGANADRLLASGANGGSGGGGGGHAGNTGLTTAGTGTVGQGFNGGSGRENAGAGGGGAGGPGQSAPSSADPGLGGVGFTSSISGTSAVYASGGNGAGSGVGGNGTDGLGDGGDGSSSSGVGGNGGSGVVIVRYLGPQRATGGVVTKAGKYTVHTFTTVGTDAFTVLPGYVNGTPINWVADLSNNDNHGAPINNPIYGSENSGYFRFDGVNQYISLSDNIADLSGDWCISVWMRPNNDENPRVVSLLTDADNLQVGYMKTTLVPYIRFDNATVSSTSALVAAEWVNVVYQVASTQRQIFINGVETTLVSGGITANGTYSAIGGGYAGYTSNGSVSLVSIYERSLTESEIQQNFNSLRGRYGI